MKSRGRKLMGKKLLYKKKKLSSYRGKALHGNRAKSVRYRRAGKREIELFRKEHWLEVMKEKIDAVIGNLVEAEGYSKKKAIQAMKEDRIRVAHSFSLNVNGQWYFYGLQMDLEHGLFFYREKTSAEPFFLKGDTRQAQSIGGKKAAKKRAEGKSK
jgi:hypothetical protein